MKTNRTAFSVLSAALLCAAAWAGAANGQRLQPTDIEYRGAFRLPDWNDAQYGWEWGGSSLTYYPGGDPGGDGDGYPGSLFGTGNDQTQHVSEVGIPAPVISAGRNPGELNTATTLQGFRNVRGNLYPFGLFEIPRVGLEYLPRQGAQTTDKLYFCWGQHMQEGVTDPTHGWCELDLANPRPAGIWSIGGYWNYVTCDYLFAIPRYWADACIPGVRLATGRARDGGQGAMGPSLIAIGPWNSGNPPANGATLPAVPLLLYGNAYESAPRAMNGYQYSDTWTGGAWLTAGSKSAVVFIGTKGVGECWYGCADGTREPPWPCEDRGWWSTGFEGRMVFYDTDELAAVAAGSAAPSDPQPYASMDIDGVLYHIASAQQWNHVGAAAFDRERGHLYVTEPFGDGEKPLVHVWKVLSDGGEPRPPSPGGGIRPIVRVNGSGGLVTLARGGAATVEVSMDPGPATGRGADWWLAAETPGGLLFFTFAGWTERPVPAHQAALLDLSNYEVFTADTSSLDPGTYTVHFGVDTKPDGGLSWNSLVYDSVALQLTDAQ